MAGYFGFRQLAPTFEKIRVLLGFLLERLSVAELGKTVSLVSFNPFSAKDFVLLMQYFYRRVSQRGSDNQKRLFSSISFPLLAAM